MLSELLRRNSGHAFLVFATLGLWFVDGRQFLKLSRVDLSLHWSLAKGEGSSEVGFDAFLFSSMRVMIVLNMLAASVGAWHLWWTSPSRKLSAAYLWGIRLGVIVFVLAGLEGGAMEARLRHGIGVQEDGGPAGVTLLGYWAGYWVGSVGVL